MKELEENTIEQIRTLLNYLEQIRAYISLLTNKLRKKQETSPEIPTTREVIKLTRTI